MAPINRFSSTRVATRVKTTSSENSFPRSNAFYSKRKAENSPPKTKTIKRPALNDLTNDGKTSKVKSITRCDKPLTVFRDKTDENVQQKSVNAKIVRHVTGVRLPSISKSKVVSTKSVKETSSKKVESVKNSAPQPPVRVTRSSLMCKSNSNTTKIQTKLTDNSIIELRRSLRARNENNTSKIQSIKEEEEKKTVHVIQTRLKTRESISKENKLPNVVIPKISATAVHEVNEELIEKEIRVTRRSSARLSLNRKSLTADKSSENNSLYVSALEDISNTAKKDKKSEWYELSEFDKELIHDPHQVSIYAAEIFQYLKSREAHFRISNYMPKLGGITKDMRSILVDWMVEVQENFELNHETLYLSVKVVDAYLDRINEIKKDKLQLVAVGAMFLACKYDERLSPLPEDFVYVCAGAYMQQDILSIEQRILSTLNYELSFPISYSFLRRYARCARVSMPLLTLARFILELSLLDYSTVTLSDSKQAAAALYLAFRMVKHDNWTESLENYTGYKLDDFKTIVFLFNGILRRRFPEEVKAVRTKYSHEVYFKVAETRLVSDEELKKSMAEHS